MERMKITLWFNIKKMTTGYQVRLRGNSHLLFHIPAHRQTLPVAHPIPDNKL